MIERIRPIYRGSLEDFVWVGFGSGSGTNLRECAKVIPPKAVFSDKPSAKLLKLEELSDVPKLVLDGYKACRSWKKAQGDERAEVEYENRCRDFNYQILEGLLNFEEEIGKPIDLIVLGGYMRFVMDPLLSHYKDKMINVHPSRLPSWGENNERYYIGGDAVYDAIKDDQASTRSSVIMVDEGEDHGEILTQGPSVGVWGEFGHGTKAEKEECLREYADAHQSFQKVRSDWPALTTALKLIAEGRLALGNLKFFHNEWRRVFVDGEPMGYEGFQVGGR